MHVHVHVAEREWYVKGRRAQRKAGRLQEKKREKRRKRDSEKAQHWAFPRGPPPQYYRSTTPAQTCLTSLFGWEAVSQADVAALNPKEENQYRLTSPSLQLSAAAPHRPAANQGSQLSLGSDPTVDRALCDRTLLWGHFRSDGTPRGTPPPLDMGRRDGHPNQLMFMLMFMFMFMFMLMLMLMLMLSPMRNILWRYPPSTDFLLQPLQQIFSLTPLSNSHYSLHSDQIGAPI